MQKNKTLTAVLFTGVQIGFLKRLNPPKYVGFHSVHSI